MDLEYDVRTGTSNNRIRGVVTIDEASTRYLLSVISTVDLVLYQFALSFCLLVSPPNRPFAYGDGQTKQKKTHHILLKKNIVDERELA